MRLSDLKKSGHAPSLLSAFLHFDISFMVWVILGALMPFLMTDPRLTGENLRITPLATIQHAGQYTLLIKGPQDDQPRTIYNLIVKPGASATATRASVKPVEKFAVDGVDPYALDRVNATSRFFHVERAPGAALNPNENVIALTPATALAASGKTYQSVANGYPAAVKLTLVAIPLLAAGFWRLLLGGLVDRFGSKRVGVASLALTLLPLLIGWKFATGYSALVFVGFFLGLAGASFAVALPLASRWYPPHLQGLAMGIAGAGNSGTVLATVFAPLLAKAYGWQSVFGLLMIPVALVLVAFTLLARDPPTATAPRRSGLFAPYLAVLSQTDAWRFCLLYFVTFGGFVGLSSFFNTFFVDQYDAPRAAVGLWTWPFIVAGSMLRPVGGALSDRLGGVRMLTTLYAVVILSAVGVGMVITHFGIACVLLLILMACLGMGNGAVFQLAPQRFRREIGILTGLVGAAGGVGGYYLNFALGHLHDATGSYAAGFWAFAAIAVVALGALRLAAPAWTRSWLGAGGVANSATPSPSETFAPPVRGVAATTAAAEA